MVFLTEKNGQQLFGQRVRLVVGQFQRGFGLFSGLVFSAVKKLPWGYLFLAGRFLHWKRPARFFRRSLGLHGDRLSAMLAQVRPQHAE
jgi:hypothetical protein